MTGDPFLVRHAKSVYLVAFLLVGLGDAVLFTTGLPCADLAAGVATIIIGGIVIGMTMVKAGEQERPRHMRLITWAATVTFAVSLIGIGAWGMMVGAEANNTGILAMAAMLTLLAAGGTYVSGRRYLAI